MSKWGGWSFSTNVFFFLNCILLKEILAELFLIRLAIMTLAIQAEAALPSPSNNQYFRDDELQQSIKYWASPH